MHKSRGNFHAVIGRAHATLTSLLVAAAERTAREDRGQGTVEYIGLVLLLAAVMAAVVTTGNGHSIGATVIGKVKDAIDGVRASSH